MLEFIFIGKLYGYTRLSNFEPFFSTEKDIEMLQDINSLVEEEVSVLDIYWSVLMVLKYQ